MRNLSLPLVVAVLGGSLLFGMASVRAAEAWQTDYASAVALAKESKRPVLIDFTGSDWCGWCIRLSKETFSQPEFLRYAKKNLVLLEVDLPQEKPQSAQLKKQNEELVAKFGVDGFPTLVILDADGKEVARQSGYLSGGPKAMIAWIESAVMKR